MNYRDWKAVYVDKTKTLEDWRAAKQAEYAAQNSSNILSSLQTAVNGKNVIPQHSLQEKRELPVLNCKNFSELKIYWADNYNIKVVDSIKKLHFESVREAMGGVEKIIKKFPEAGKLLKEFDVLRKRNAPMSAQYGGRFYNKPNKINFNPDYFDNPEHLRCMIMGTSAGLHPKNTGILETGSHEMGHILEDWITGKHNGTFQDLMNHVYARKIIQKAYSRAKLTAGGKLKTIVQMRFEISNYAGKYPVHETLSEAISDYIANGEIASVLSVEIWERLEEELS